MSKTQKSALLRFENLILLVFFLSFLVWAVSKCNATKAEYQQYAPPPEQIDESTTPVESTEEIPAETTADPTPAPVETVRTVRERVTPLYITIDELNMRAEPSLESEILAKLTLFEEVIFMNEVTDFQQTISLGLIEATEPWIKVKTQKGKVGWVYGAGVNYYKTKLEGVQ